MARISKPLVWGGIAVVALIGAWAWQHFGLGSLLTLDHLKASRDALQAQVLAQPLLTAALFFAIYVAAAALSIPGAVILTLAAGALFGLGWGLLLVSFASSAGALLAFLVARYLLRDTIQARFGKALAPINEGVRKDGTFYLLTLRLVPVFPFWLINLLMGLTPMGAGRFYLVSQIGMLAGTAVYVNAGTQLAAIQSPGDILSPGLLGSFVLLGLFPLLAKAGVGWLERRKVYAKWTKPKHFDRNLVVIGAGAGGLVSAYIAAAVKAKVTLIEGHKMGGDCLNFGCVPSKALIRSAKMARQLKKAHELGVAEAAGRVDFAAVMQRVHGVIRDIEPHDSVERFTGLGVEVLQGHARITSPWSVEVARVGLSETEAKEQGIAYEVTKYGIDDLDRAIADGTAHGFVKVLTVPGKDRILGVTIVGEHAGDLLAEYVLAMKHGLGLNKILGTIHTYPTLAEANKYAAGEWRRANAPQKLLQWVGRFHAWERA